MKDFAYTDISDKCYGMAGRAITLRVLDNNYMIHHITIDNNDEEEAMTFTPDFFFCANPRYSAKITWNEMLKQYQMLVGLVVGDIMCRTRVRARRPVDVGVVDDIRRLVEDEGRDACSLDDDEIDTVFNKTFRYLDRVFCDSRVQQMADIFADTLQRRRSLAGDEIADMLNSLG